MGDVGEMKGRCRGDIGRASSSSSARLSLASCAALSSRSSSPHRAQAAEREALAAEQWQSLTGTRQCLHVGCAFASVGTMMTRSLEAEAARCGFARASGLVARGWRRPLVSLRAGCGAMWYTDSMAFTPEKPSQRPSPSVLASKRLTRSVGYPAVGSLLSTLLAEIVLCLLDPCLRFKR